MTEERILVVDDDPGLLKLMQVRLEAVDYQVRLASSGSQALSLMSDEMPDLAIVDLKMEDMDGITLLEKQR